MHTKNPIYNVTDLLNEVKTFMKENDVSQRQIAEHTKIARVTIQRYFNRGSIGSQQPTNSILKKLREGIDTYTTTPKVIKPAAVEPIRIKPLDTGALRTIWQPVTPWMVQ